MTIFMLHFDCRSSRPDHHGRHVTADACVIGESLDEAETLAHDAIMNHGYQAEGLIAYAQVEKAQIVELDEYETVLYLKAMQQDPSVAVMFS